MGGRSETASEFNSMASSDDKRAEHKGKKLTCKTKMEANEPSVLTYTSDENVYYEPGGRRKHIFRDKSRSHVKTPFEFKLIWLFVPLE